MIDYFFWALILVGSVYLITESTIMSPIRIFLSDTLGGLIEVLLYCPPCAGFWVGMILGAAGTWPHDSQWAPLESGVAAMAVMATWSKAFGGNRMWALERGHPDDADPVDEDDDDTTQTRKAREESDGR